MIFKGFVSILHRGLFSGIMGMEVVMEHDRIVKSNLMIEAKYRLSLMEQKILLSAIAKINPEDEEQFGIYHLDLKYLAKVLGEKNKDIMSRIRKASEKLADRKLRIQEMGGKREIYTHWVSSVIYDHGEISIELPKVLKPYLFRLKDRFTVYRLGQILKFQSVYTIRFYELLAEFHGLFQQFHLSVQKIREMVQLQNHYPKYADFKRRVLGAAYQELKERSSDLYFEFEEIKEGRSVTTIRFSIMSRSKASENQKPRIVTTEEMSARLMESGYLKEEFLKYLKEMAPRWYERYMEREDFEYFSNQIGFQKQIEKFIHFKQNEH